MNTHQKFKTINHHHFDFCYFIGGVLNSPESGLMLVECEDGRWFVQQEYGVKFSQFHGVLKSDKDLDTQPIFYLNVEEAAIAAFSLIKQVYPATDDQLLQNFIES